jgi:hypothetical protein
MDDRTGWFSVNELIPCPRPKQLIVALKGYLCFVVRRVKRGTAHIRAFVKSIASPYAANDLRCMVWKELKIALQIIDISTHDPKRVCDVIARKMKELLNRRDMGVALGTFISSHSWRNDAGLLLRRASKSIGIL